MRITFYLVRLKLLYASLLNPVILCTFYNLFFNCSPVKDTIVVNDRWGTDANCKHGDVKLCKDRYSPSTSIFVRFWFQEVTQGVSLPGTYLINWAPRDYFLLFSRCLEGRPSGLDLEYLDSTLRAWKRTKRAGFVKRFLRVSRLWALKKTIAEKQSQSLEIHWVSKSYIGGWLCAYAQWL